MFPQSIARKLVKSAALLTLAVGACAVSASAADASLLGTHWRLVTIDGMQANASRREPSIVLGADGSLAGNTGCNNFGGGYTLNGPSLTVGRVFTTRMYCRTVWQQERALLAALPQVARWQVNGDRLELKDAAGTTLAVFEATPGAE